MRFIESWFFYMRRGRNLSAAALLMSLIIWLSFSAADAAEMVDRIVAVVNGDIIVLSELRQISRNYLDRMSDQFKVAGGKSSYGRRKSAFWISSLTRTG